MKAKIAVFIDRKVLVITPETIEEARFLNGIYIENKAEFSKEITGTAKVSVRQCKEPMDSEIVIRQCN